MSRAARPVPTLYRKTLAALAGVVVVVVLAGGLLSTRALERCAIDSLAQSLTMAARLLEPNLLLILKGSADAAAVQPLVAAGRERSGYQLTVMDPRGAVLGDSEQPAEAIPRMENQRDRPEVQAALAGRTGTHLQDRATTARHPMLSVAWPVTDQDTVRGVLRVAAPLTVVAEVRRDIRRVVVWSLLIGLILATLLAAWLARRVTQPLHRLIRVATAYAGGDLTATPDGASIREVQDLTEALDTMARTLREHISQLTSERNQATAILEGMAEGVIAVDSHGRILLMNPSAEVLLGLAGANTSGKNFFETIRNQETQALVRTVLQRRERATQDIAFFQPKERLLRIHGVPCQDRGPAEPRAVLVIQDVTESHRYEQLRKEFVANVSHELKSPLTSIRSLTDTLLDAALNDPASSRRFVGLIDEDAARLSRLIDDLLALSQIESQAVPLRLSVTDFKPLVESVLASLQPGVSQRRLAVAIEVPPGLAVRADADRLRQVLFNLLDNAIKYSRDQGRVVVSAARQGDWAKVMVTDTGIGIPGEDLPRIFERFYRVDKARSRALGGTGLGLSIVKHIIEAHGGAVSVDSEVNQGSQFSFTVPLVS